jgi:hypothetical protein
MGGVAVSDPEPARISLDDVTEAAFSGVLRALEARKISPEKFPGPILVGIIAWPELSRMGKFPGTVSDLGEKGPE